MWPVSYFPSAVARVGTVIVPTCALRAEILGWRHDLCPDADICHHSKKRKSTKQKQYLIQLDPAAQWPRITG